MTISGNPRNYNSKSRPEPNETPKTTKIKKEQNNNLKPRAGPHGGGDWEDRRLGRTTLRRWGLEDGK